MNLNEQAQGVRGALEFGVGDILTHEMKFAYVFRVGVQFRRP